MMRRLTRRLTPVLRRSTHPATYAARLAGPLRRLTRRLTPLGSPGYPNTQSFSDASSAACAAAFFADSPEAEGFRRLVVVVCRDRVVRARDFGAGVASGAGSAGSTLSTDSAGGVSRAAGMLGSGEGTSSGSGAGCVSTGTGGSADSVACAGGGGAGSGCGSGNGIATVKSFAVAGPLMPLMTPP